MIVVAAGEILQQIEAAGQDMIGGNVEPGGNRLEPLPLRHPLPKARDIAVARVKQDHAPGAQEIVELGIGRVGGQRLIRRDRPVKEGEKLQIVLLQIDADRGRRLDRGAGGEFVGKPL